MINTQIMKYIAIFWKWVSCRMGLRGQTSPNFKGIYRSHEVDQFYKISFGIALIAITHALWTMVEIRPQVVVSLHLCKYFIFTKLQKVSMRFIFL